MTGKREDRLAATAAINGEERKTLLLDRSGAMTGKLLIGMPTLADVFAKSLVYVCAHGPAGAMGFIINRALPHVTYADLMRQLDVEAGSLSGAQRAVHYGGPVDTKRGFVLHTLDTRYDETVAITPQIGITGTLGVMRDIGQGGGPARHLFALGYAGWDAGQLEDEIAAGAWLTVNDTADDALIFADDLDAKWPRALSGMGIDPVHLFSEGGRA